MQHLNIDHYEHCYTNRPDLLTTDLVAHIPIRNPMAVARSWARRRKTGNVIDDLVDSYDMMFRIIDRQPHELHKIEDILTVVGKEHRLPQNHAQVRTYQKQIAERVVDQHPAFFRAFGY